MRLYLFRHPESDAKGELTPRGLEQTHEIMDWLVAEIGRVDMVIAWGIPAAMQAAQIAADKLGTFVALTVIPEHWEPEQADAKIRQMAERTTDTLVIVPDSRYLEYFVGAAKMNPGATACLVVSTEGEALQWLVTRGLVFRSTQQAQVAEAARGFVRALKEANYYYEDITLKRWVLGDGGQSGNCEDCEENSDEGWIEESDIFPAGDQPVDEPPLHPNDTCDVEYKDTRRRVHD